MLTFKTIGYLQILWIIIFSCCRSIPCSDCPKCKCQEIPSGQLIADCSKKKIQSIPKFAYNVVKIILRENEIKEISSAVNFPQNITYLDLSNNMLKTFAKNSFDNFKNLVYLDLSGNEILYTEGCFKDSGLFKQLRSLKTLKIALNHNTRAGILLYPDVITQITTLERLTMDGVDGAKFSKNFTKLINLKSLDISGILNVGRCNIQAISLSLFLHTRYLVHLNMSGCNITHIKPGSLSILQNLKEFNISNNERLTFKFLNTIIKELQSMHVEVFDLSKIHCTYGVGVALYKSDIAGLSNTSITHMYLDSNRIAMVESQLVYELPSSLTYLSIRDNKFTMGTYILQLGSVTGLKTFVGDNQYDSHDPTDVTNRFEICNDWRGPPDYFVDDYKETKLPDDIFQLFQKSMVTVNQHTSEKRCHTTGLEPIFSFPPSMETMHFSKSGLQYAIPCLHMNPNNSIQHVDVSQNVLYKWYGPIYYLEHLRTLDLSENFCDDVSNIFFSEFKNLRTLLIHKNLLGFVLHEKKYYNLFQNLSELRHLNMSNNRIRSLPKLILDNQPHLQILNLSNNIINDWDIEMANLRKLSLLDLSFNQIPFLRPSSRKHIEENNNIQINLRGNRLQCSCDTVEFLKWMQTFRHKFQFFETYFCQFSNEPEEAYFSNIRKIIEDLEHRCKPMITVILGGVVASLFCLSGVISILVYHFRWRLRYKYYLIKNRLAGYIRNVEKPNYTYDACISYAENDANIVVKLVEFLEDRQGMHLCIHKRDFIPGVSIAENITRVINCSRRLIIILSESYINSNWCMYEFNIARMECMDSREETNFMFVILCENIPDRQLPIDMSALIKSKSYVKVPDNKEIDEQFLIQIIESIK